MVGRGVFFGGGGVGGFIDFFEEGDDVFFDMEVGMGVFEFEGGVGGAEVVFEGFGGDLEGGVDGVRGVGFGVLGGGAEAAVAALVGFEELEDFGCFHGVGFLFGVVEFLVFDGAGLLEFVLDWI